MEKRKLADQANTLVDLSKVGEASGNPPETSSAHLSHVQQSNCVAPFSLHMHNLNTTS